MLPKVKKEPWHLVVVAVGRLGKKVMAAREIHNGDHIMHFTGHPLSFAETKKTKEESFNLQIGQDQYLYLDEPYRLINHSCDPSCGVTPGLDLVALRDIRKGEELTYDYSTTMLENSWTMQCSCGSPRCRKEVRDFTTLPKHLQHYYLGRHVVQGFIARSLPNA